MTEQKQIKVLIIAGEPSGDIHAALLMKQLKNSYHNIQFVGIGGEKMEAEGLKSIISIKEIAIIGIVEVVKRARLLMKLIKTCKKILKDEHIDCFIPVDYPGFNIEIAKYSKKLSIPVFYYIAPQLWAWGENRWKKLKDITDILFVILPFEEKYFNDKGIHSIFVGHPLLDIPIFSNKIVPFQDRENIISFFPGSRKQEVEKNLQLFSETADILNKAYLNYEFAFAISSNVAIENFSHLKKYNFNYKLYHNSYELMQKAKIGIVKAGTTTLEAALLGMNMLMAYKTSFTHYQFGKHFINLNYIALPNIILNSPVIPELIQAEATSDNLATRVKIMIENPEFCHEQQSKFLELHEILGKQGASQRVAETIIQSIR